MQLISLSPQEKNREGQNVHTRKFFKDLPRQNVGEYLINVQPS